MLLPALPTSDSMVSHLDGKFSCRSEQRTLRCLSIGKVSTRWCDILGLEADAILNIRCNGEGRQRSSLMQVLTFLAQSFVFDVGLRKCHKGDDHNDRLRSQQG